MIYYETIIFQGPLILVDLVDEPNHEVNENITYLYIILKVFCSSVYEYVFCLKTLKFCAPK